MRQLIAIVLIIVCNSVMGQNIEKSDLISTSKVFDLSFTQKEIDTLYSDVVDNLKNYQLMHQLHTIYYLNP